MTDLSGRGRSFAGAAPIGTSLPRTLHLIGSLHRGGTEHQLVQFIRRSSDPSAHVVAVCDALGPLAAELPGPAHLVGPIPHGVRELRADVRLFRDVRRLIARERIELVHAHLSMAELLASMIVPFGTPIIASRRGRTPGHEDRLWFRAAQSFSHRRVSVMLCNSEELARFTVAHDPSPPPILVIRNGVDLDRFGPSPVPAEPVVLAVANLIAYKRHDLFLRSFALVHRQMPEARAVLVGEGPERRAIERLVDELALRRAVRLEGRVDDTRPYITDARVVALTSDHEGLPNALLEAMAMGRPVVSRPVGGVPELVRDGVEGILAPADPHTFASALLRILQDRPSADRMGAAARRKAEEFDWESVIKRVEDVYRGVVRGERFASATLAR